MDQVNEGEYKQPVEGITKTYTHEIFFCIDKKGKIIQLRLSFDEDHLFVRSAHILKMAVDDMTGDCFYKKTAVKNIYVVDRDHCKVQDLGNL